MQYYRVRKTWSDAKSQIGAFINLDNAKKCVDSHPGYKAYGEGGKLVYPAPKDTKTSVTTSYVQAMKPLFAACEKMCDLLYKSTYKWESKPNVEKAKKRSTCVTYVACVLQSLGILKSGEYVWHNGRGYGDGKVYGNNALMDVIYLGNKKPGTVKLKIKSGDILMHDQNKSGKRGDGGHTDIYKGTVESGKAMCYSGGCGSGHNTSKNYADPRTILAVVRPKVFKITNECLNGTISGASLVLAKQDVIFKYAPNEGKTLKSVTIDGKAVDIKKFPSSYTFKDVTKNHSIKVAFK